MMAVGKLIKLYLVKNNISQSWLSKQIGMTTPQLCSSLNEERKISIEEYDKIMNALNLPVDAFIGKKVLVEESQPNT